MIQSIKSNSDPEQVIAFQDRSCGLVIQMNIVLEIHLPDLLATVVRRASADESRGVDEWVELEERSREGEDLVAKVVGRCDQVKVSAATVGQAILKPTRCILLCDWQGGVCQELAGRGLGGEVDQSRCGAPLPRVLMEVPEATKKYDAHPEFILRDLEHR